mmetsp:Transcript_27179/g.59335  ORF Transcript_27179/g.59335 Transcript_27179/m.59335 type:complete len:260 (-) Transcript_27179:786-1565(-)
MAKPNSHIGLATCATSHHRSPPPSLGLLDVLGGEAGQLQGPLDEGGEVLGGQVGGGSHTSLVDCEQVILVGLGGVQHTVGGHEDGTGEVGKVTLLAVPGATKVAGQVGVLVQARVAVGGQHLAVCVDLDAGALGLLQEQVHVVHVVAGHEDGLALLGDEGHVSGGGGAEGVAVGLGQHLHHAVVALAHTQRHAQAGVNRAALGATQEGEGLGHKGCDMGVTVAQGLCMVCVCAHPLEAVHHQLLQATQGLAQRGLADLN